MYEQQTRPRRVRAETLDALDADNPAAQRSRRDLRRLHRVMGTLSIVLGALDVATARPPQRILELGAGDGSLMLRLAQHRAMRWPGVAVTLLDRQSVIQPAALAGLRAVGWTPSVVTADVFEWLQQPQAGQWDMVLAHLFVHHFAPPELSRLFGAIAASTQIFFCCEPRRSMVSLAGSYCVGLIGAGPVTRNDAVLSVHAGFHGRELTAAWPLVPGWQLDEYPARLFSHCLLARRSGG